MENTKKVIVTPVVQTITVGYKAEPVYTFDGLPKDVQRQVVDDEIAQRQDDGVDNIPWLDEDWDSFQKVAEILNIETETETSEYGTTISILEENNNEHIEMCCITGLRAYKYIVNNFLPDFRRGKYYSLGYNKEKGYYPWRHSKCQFNYDGDGYCLDLIPNEVWQGMKKGIVTKNLSVMDFIQAVVDEYADEISQEIIYFFSCQGVQEELSERGDYWTKDGEPVGANDVKEVATGV